MKEEIRKRGMFLAFPWTPFEKAFYEDLAKKYSKEWNVYMGAQLITKPIAQGQLEEFRNRNKQLFQRFVENIVKADIFIADISSSNPNVMIELGIAIKLNKNVLILSGIATERIPFDISGVHIEFYRDRTKIKDIIDGFLRTFGQIKEMDFSSPVPGSYFYLESGNLVASPQSTYRIHLPMVHLPRMKDLKMRIKYRVVDYDNESNWFGFLLRAAESTGNYEPLFGGAVLVNSRVNGSTEITTYPGEVILKTSKTSPLETATQLTNLEVTLDGSYIKVTKGEKSFSYSNLTFSDFGHIYLACYKANIEFKDLEILNIDTTTEIL